MTTYILAGGSDRKYEDYGERLVFEVQKRVKNPVILSCFFSSEETTWQKRYEDWDEWLKKHFGLAIRHELANPATFLAQVEAADVIYLHGGDTMRLLGAIPNFEQVKKAFNNKVVIGSSAGANYLSQAAYGVSKDTFLHGSGIVPINVMVHYGVWDFNGRHRTDEDWQRTREKFQHYIGAGETVTLLPEGTFVVVEQ